MINDFSEERRLKRALQLSTPVLAVNAKPLPVYALQNECCLTDRPIVKKVVRRLNSSKVTLMVSGFRRALD